MDIIKQITVLVWMLGVVVITPPVLRYFDVDIETAYRKVLALEAKEPAAAPARDGVLPQKQELNPAVFDELFKETQETPQQRQTAEEAFKRLMADLKISGDAVAAAGGQVEEVPSMFRYQRGAENKVRWSPPPPGFKTAETFNYLIYREQQPVGNKLKDVLDAIHGNLMLDLTPFTLVSKPNKILVMLFDKKETYMNFTKRPAWSGASSDLQADSMYVLEGNNFYPLSVHELTHLYFDGYFLPSISPLWLSEGMAMYMQIQVTKRKPSWLDSNLKRIIDGQYITLENMFAMEDLSALDTAEAELWYTQAYSVLYYMLNRHSRDEFYRFCNELKAGAPVHQALYRAYGMPFTKVSVLQNVWLYDVSKRWKATPTTQPKGPVSAEVLSSTRTVSVPVAQPAQPAQAPRPAAEPAQTVIPKLQMVETNGYKGHFQ